MAGFGREEISRRAMTNVMLYSKQRVWGLMVLAGAFLVVPCVGGWATPLTATVETAQAALVGPTLKGSAGKGLLIGGAVATVDLQDAKLAALIAGQFNCLTPEYEFMPEKMVDDQGHFTFEQGDKVVAFAEKNHMPVFGHMLVWHYVTRRWLFEDEVGKPLPREKTLANLKTYIDGVVGHYKGRIKAWDVVNEGISDKDDEYLKDTPALRAIGEDYIAKAFEFAHDADPGAQLLLQRLQYRATGQVRENGAPHPLSQGSGGAH